MKVRVYTTGDQFTSFTSLDQAFNHVVLNKLNRYMFLIDDQTGFSIYDSLRAKWSFPEALKTAELLVSLELE